MKKIRELAEIVKENEALSRALDHQAAVIGMLEKVVSRLEEVLVEKENQEKGEPNLSNENHVHEDCAMSIEPIAVDYSNVKFGNDEEKCFSEIEASSSAVNETSNMCTRMEHEPRQQRKGPALQTPWTSYSRKRKKHS